MENFKCVDYFQIEYYQQEDPEGTAKLTGKINRHRKSHDIDIKPCSDYLFKVLHSLWMSVKSEISCVGYCLRGLEGNERRFPDGF